MSAIRNYVRLMLEQQAQSKGSLVVVDVQPEYEGNTSFDIGDMLRSAARDYSSVLFLFNGEDTLGMVSESALKNFYFEKLDYDVFNNRAYVKGWVKALNLPISYLITINDEKYKLRTLIN